MKNLFLFFLFFIIGSLQIKGQPVNLDRHSYQNYLVVFVDNKVWLESKIENVRGMPIYQKSINLSNSQKIPIEANLFIKSKFEKYKLEDTTWFINHIKEKYDSSFVLIFSDTNRNNKMIVIIKFNDYKKFRNYELHITYRKGVYKFIVDSVNTAILSNDICLITPPQRITF